jgi:outer membrane protein OmpA-like peptidoglycan-associated protein
MKSMKLSMVALLAASGLSFADDVKVYDRAPSVEELQRQLSGGEPGAPKKKMRTRAIVFGDAAAEPAPAVPAAAEPAATVQIAPAAAPSRPAPAAHARPAPEAAPAATTMEVGENAIAFPINFRVNSAEILPGSIPFLESIAGLLMKDPSTRLLVEGHTDSSGSAQRNMELSRERAYSVRNYLIDHYRIDPMRLMPVGKGFSEPLGGLESTNPKNRRVQFRIIG